MNRTRRIGLLLAAFLLFPATAYADAGTPLMWAGFLHLLFGNALIGFGEGWLIARVFGIRKKLMIYVMIGVNYFSMFVGYLGIDWLTRRFAQISLYQAWAFIWITLLASFILSVLLEWPFIMVCFRKRKHWFRISFVASLFAQCASYLIIVPWYFLASGASLYTQTKLDPSLSFVTNKNSLVYFISTHDRNVYRQRILDSKPQKVFDLASIGVFDRLFVARSSDADYWDLYAATGSSNSKRSQKVLVRSKFARHASSFPVDTEDTWFNFGLAAELRPRTQREWEFKAGSWSFEGLRIRNTKTAKTIRLALETPFLQWSVRNPTALPGDQVVFQLGDQICIFDRNSRKLGLITWGRGPVVVLEPAEVAEVPSDKLNE